MTLALPPQSPLLADSLSLQNVLKKPVGRITGPGPVGYAWLGEMKIFGVRLGVERGEQPPILLHIGSSPEDLAMVETGPPLGLGDAVVVVMVVRRAVRRRVCIVVLTMVLWVRSAWCYGRCVLCKGRQSSWRSLERHSIWHGETSVCFGDMVTVGPQTFYEIPHKVVSVNREKMRDTNLRGGFEWWTTIERVRGRWR